MKCYFCQNLLNCGDYCHPCLTYYSFNNNKLIQLSTYSIPNLVVTIRFPNTVSVRKLFENEMLSFTIYKNYTLQTLQQKIINLLPLC